MRLRDIYITHTTAHTYRQTHTRSIKWVLFICCSYQCGYGPLHNTEKVLSSLRSPLISSISLPKALTVFWSLFTLSSLLCRSSTNISFHWSKAGTKQDNNVVLMRELQTWFRAANLFKCTVALKSWNVIRFQVPLTLSSPTSLPAFTSSCLLAVHCISPCFAQYIVRSHLFLPVFTSLHVISPDAHTEVGPV